MMGVGAKRAIASIGVEHQGTERATLSRASVSRRALNVEMRARSNILTKSWPA